VVHRVFSPPQRPVLNFSADVARSARSGPRFIVENARAMLQGRLAHFMGNTNDCGTPRSRLEGALVPQVMSQWESPFTPKGQGFQGVAFEMQTPTSTWFLPRRGFGTQPRVAPQGLPWVARPPHLSGPTPKGLRNRELPQPLRGRLKLLTQGSPCGATLGYVPQRLRRRPAGQCLPLWDSCDRRY